MSSNPKQYITEKAEENEQKRGGDGEGGEDRKQRQAHLLV